jgi:hypothetical protein
MKIPNYTFAAGEHVATQRELHTIGGDAYPAGSVWIVSRRRDGRYTLVKPGTRHYVRAVRESTLRPLTDEERAAISADGGEHAEG